MNNPSLFAAYVRQQKELSMPDFVLGPDCDVRHHLRALFPEPSAGERATYAKKAGAAGAGRRSSPADPFSRLKKLDPVSAVSRPAAVGTRRTSPDVSTGSLPYEQKRTQLKKLYTARCSACRLAAGRKNFVFGSGNVDAALMIIGGAPGAEEDERGLPFIGPAGDLLTELLTSIGLDRKKDVFITDVLKCRPPEAPDPDGAEVKACLPLLDKQIEIIAPRLLLLLGSVPARALLGISGEATVSRGSWRSYKGIPALVTYHTSDVLNNAGYRSFADEDFRSVLQRLKESG